METKPFSQAGLGQQRYQSVDGFIRRPTPRPITRKVYMPVLPAPRPVMAAPETARLTVPPQAPKRRTASRLPLFAAVFAVGFVGIMFFLRPENNTPAVVPMARASALHVPVSTPAAPSPAPQDPTADMNAAIAAQPDLSAAATLTDLDTGTTYNAGNYTQNYIAASTSKLVAIFDYLHQVELGKATLTQRLSGVSAQENIMRMIVYSDNDAWARLNRYLTFPGEQRYVNSLGITATIQPDNMQFSTPNMAALLTLLYQGKLMNPDHQTMIYGYMAHTTVTNLIQAALPADATVYHKYGQLYGVLHDASIVEYHGHHFVLVIYTNNPAGTTHKSAEQVALIHAITTAAFHDETL